MSPLRPAVALAIAACAVAAAPAAANERPAPTAHAAGGSAGTPTYPGLVNNRLIRTQKAVDRAIDYADDGDNAKAVSALYTARLQVKLAWRAAKYVIQHAPPPVVGDDLIARASGGAPPAGTVADQFQTSGAVLDLQHDVAQASIGMIDTAKGTLRDSLSRTLFLALDQRDTAIAYVHSIDVPPPPGDDLVAHMSGGAVGGSWASIMPAVGSAAGDEIDQIDGAMDLSSTLGTGVRGVLRDAELQVLKTQKAINQYWPPLPGDD